jgi:hypothetical protein
MLDLAYVQIPIITPPQTTNIVLRRICTGSSATAFTVQRFPMMYPNINTIQGLELVEIPIEPLQQVGKKHPF